MIFYGYFLTVSISLIAYGFRQINSIIRGHNTPLNIFLPGNVGIESILAATAYCIYSFN
jgi:hypothetical protein